MFFLAFLLLLFRATVANNFIDVNDILNVDYMPGSLLLLEGASDEQQVVERNISVKHSGYFRKNSGSIMEAYNTMGYHRKMMNEYLCRNFVADQILSDMSITRVRRRLGTAVSRRHSTSNNLPNPGKNKADVAPLRNSLLLDEGSLNYKHWLQKSATLEDIYRRYEQMEDRQDDHIPGEDDAEQDREEYDGDVSGYAVQVPHSPPRGTPSKLGYGHSAPSGYPGGYPAGSGHSGYGSSGHGSGYDFMPQHLHYHHGDYGESQGKGGDKELVLADLFEIALTAIAFLSFGCFVLQVIMCISMASNTTTTMTVTMMPMTMTMMPMADDGDVDTDSTGMDGGDEPTRIRYKRETPMNGNSAINDLARRVLLSMESTLVTEDDDGNCLRQKLCENNKYSRSLSSSQKLWVPVWSFAMSWLTGRLNSRVPPATAMLDSLKASILGLGNANCKIMYNNCNLNKLRDNRRRRRKKRTAGDEL